MPELPEVETVCRQLNETAKGRIINGLVIHDHKLALSANAESGIEAKFCVKHSIAKVFRSGKQIAVELIGPRKVQSWILFHLRMTGRLYHMDRLPENISEKHLRLTVKLDQGNLFFVDQRRFGLVLQRKEKIGILPKGVDPVSADFTLNVFKDLLAGSRIKIKPWLLKQDKVTGLGNIYASEILFEAGVDPERLAGSLTDMETKKVHHATIRILNKAIEMCGTTFSDFQDSTGTEGKFGTMLKVYNRGGKPCLSCDTEIIKFSQQQRSTFWCPACQQ
jgi:formamidopyrimidine-DNA glycosylase